MPERDISSSLDYLRALTEYIEALQRVRTHARFQCQAVLDNVADHEDAAILLHLIDLADDANPVMRCGS